MKSSPKEIFQLGGDQVKVIWQDGHDSVYPVSYLRARCPCAVCVDEWTGASRIDPAGIPPDVKVEKSQLVGNYAVAFQFSDGHSTGVYSFEKLRELCPCAICSKTASH